MKYFFLMVAFLLVALLTLSAPATENKPLNAGVLLTFDDTHVSQWVQALPLLQQYEARATFFVTRFDKLSSEQRAGLKTIEAAGHEIGCHGLRHIKAADYTASKGIEEYLAKEITPALAAMAQADFVPTSFAYPSSNNNGTTDEALLKTFRHLRTGTGVKEGHRLAQMDVLFTPVDQMAQRGLLVGKGIDRIGYPGKEEQLAQLFEAMERAAAKGEILTLYAHGIAESGKHHHIKPDTLEKVLAHGKKLGLRFYTFSDMP